jgi:hypothetical protein
MLLATLLILGVVVYLYLKKKRKSAEVVRDSTPAVDVWVRETLEHELAEAVLGLKNSTPEERKRLKQTLANEPDADVVSKIEDVVRAVELEFLRYAYEKEVDVTLRVRFVDGKTSTVTRRLSTDDVPDTVLVEYREKGTTRVFRTWSFPWQQARLA